MNNAKGRMQTEVKGKPFENGKMTIEYSQDFASDHLVETVTQINRNGLKGQVTDIQLNEVILNIRDVEVSEKYEVEVHHDYPLIKIHFEIEGSNRYMPNSSTSGVPIYIPQGHYNFFYIPEVDGVLSFDTKKRKTLEIKFTEAFLKRILGNDMKDTSAEFVDSLKKKKPFVMWENGAPITVELKEYIDAICNCRFEGNIKKVFLEAKVMELLVVLQATLIRKNKKDKDQLSSKELETILEIGTYIEKNLEQSLTIAELATTFGTNTSKLKQQFKSVFNTTIFKYMTDVRMKYAKSLIKSKDTPISEVAYRVGYKNSQHFTVAFKKTYGYLPSSLLKTGNRKML
ncbi:AraC family transcriptional regulator [Flammeovirgaceae bacterium SG7u.111]|nr:AraC family transcriptional regulator [Flammeovirgaceae bacterium SG7u.132]WPO34891.1 AraC family transcriptional regulator [Flammeovirgaceae bacterium SG7u.111]